MATYKPQVNPYPVGAVYYSTVNTLPATISAIGTWVQITTTTSGGATTVYAQSARSYSLPATVAAEPVYRWKRTA